MISAKSLKLREFLGYLMLWLASMTAAVPVCPAMAAEAAGTQTDFWTMHDYLFEHQQALADLKKRRPKYYYMT